MKKRELLTMKEVDLEFNKNTFISKSITNLRNQAMHNYPQHILIISPANANSTICVELHEKKCLWSGLKL